MPQTKRAKGAGTTRKLPSGRWQARFRGPDGVMRPAPVTFDTTGDAEVWLALQAKQVAQGYWQPPKQREAQRTLRSYAEVWLEERDLKPSTRALYRTLLDQLILPALGHLPLDRVDVDTVKDWHRSLDPSTPTRRAHAYSLLRSIFSTAFADDIVTINPCRIRGAGSAKRQHQTSIASPAEIEVIAATVPDRYRAMVLLSAWCGLRFGETTELRRKDIDLERGRVRVDRAVTRVGGRMVIGDPKSDAGKRTVSIPPNVLPALQRHLEQHAGEDPEALLFPARKGAGAHMQPSTLYRVFYPAREAAGRPDLRWHDLRHTGGTMATQAGATLAEVMQRLGHSTSSAALRYQHSVDTRQDAIAQAMALLAEAQAMPVATE